MVPIRENLLSSAKYDLKVPVESCAKDMKYIVVHNTANDASAANEVAYMIRNDSSTSFNAAVDDKGDRCRHTARQGRIRSGPT